MGKYTLESDKFKTPLAIEAEQFVGLVDENKRLAAEIEQFRKRITDLESLAHEAEYILGEIDCDDGPLDIGDWRCWYRELGLLPTKDADPLLPPVEHNDGKSCLQRMTDGFFTKPGGDDNNG